MITSGRVLYKFLLAFTETSFNSVVGMLSGWLPFLLSCAWACVASDMNNQIKMQGLSDNKRLLFIVKIFNVIIANIAIGGDICNYFCEILMLYNEDIWEFKKNWLTLRNINAFLFYKGRIDNMKYGFIKVASAVPSVKVADCVQNTKEMEVIIAQAEGRGVEIIVFPELSVTGYTCQDLFR